MQPNTLVDLLEWHAARQPDKAAYIYLADGEREEGVLTYRQLATQAKAVAVALRAACEPGDRAILLYHSGLEFLTGFFGCLYAGVVAVPAYPPKKNSSVARIEVISADAQAAVALTTTQIKRDVERHFELSVTLKGIPLLATDLVAPDGAAAWTPPQLETNSLAFLQYTSGSTGNPKGVMVGHDNLLHNLAAIDERFGHTPESCMVTWLPVFHDLGLIYTILMPLYKGFPCYIMAPAAFVTKPMRWIRALSTYRATHSAAPNFAYDLCYAKAQEQESELEGLDLSNFQAVINGAEPVRAGTIRNFLRVFGPRGFRPEAMCPGYGLAEGTLVVNTKYAADPSRELVADAAALERHEVLAGRPGRKTTTLVSCGKPLEGVQVIIADPDTHAQCPAGRVGEIWLAGGSVTKGYWQHRAATEETFGAYVRNTGDGPCLRTGDLGFLYDGELFITGRLKDLLVIRGVNHYPQDIELTAENSHAALRKGHCVAFSVDVADEERLVIACELNRSALQNFPEREIYDRVREAVGVQHALDVYAIVLLKTMSIPKTSSGKIQRQDCKKRFLRGGLTLVAGSGPAPQALLNLSYFGRLRQQLLCGTGEAAVRSGDKVLSLAQLTGRADALARTLADLKVNDGERLALHLVPVPEMLITVLALMKTGMPFIPLDWHEEGTVAYPPCGDNLTLLIPYKATQLSLPRGTRRTVYLDVHTGAAGADAAPADAWPDDQECFLAVTAPPMAGGTAAPHTYGPDAVRSYCNYLNARLGAGAGDTLRVQGESGTLWAALDLLWALAAGTKLVFAGRKGEAEAAPPEAPAEPVQFSLLYFSSNEAAFSQDKYQVVLEGAKFADAHGFHAVWLPERHFHAFGGLYPDPCVLAAALSTVTRRIRLRAGSVVLPLHDPIRVAESWSVVDNLSGGRVDLAFARGWNPNDFVLSPDTFANNRDVLFSRLETVKRLWRGGAITRPNAHGKNVELQIFPLPHQPELPVWITCSGGEEMFVQAGEAGANVLTALLFQSPQELERKIAAYRQARARSGHPAEGGKVTLMLHTFVHPDPAYVRRQVEEPFKKYLRSSVDLWQHEFNLDKMTGPEREKLLEYAFERYFSTTALFGTPEGCLQAIERFREAGVDEVAALIDFGIDAATVLENLVHLDALRQRAAALAPGNTDAEGRTRTAFRQALQAEGVTLLQCGPEAAAGLLADPSLRETNPGLRLLVTGKAPGSAAAPAGAAGGLTWEERSEWAAAHRKKNPALPAPVPQVAVVPVAAVPAVPVAAVPVPVVTVAPVPVVTVPAAPLSGTDEQLQQHVRKRVTSCVAKSLIVIPEQVPPNKSFYSIGVDSIRAVEIITHLSQSLQVDLSPSVLFEASTVDRLTEHLLTHYRPSLSRQVQESLHPL